MNGCPSHSAGQVAQRDGLVARSTNFSDRLICLSSLWGLTTPSSAANYLHRNRLARADLAWVAHANFAPKPGSARTKPSFDNAFYTCIGLILSRFRKLQYPVNGGFE